jgi:hypothetical protein
MKLRERRLIDKVDECGSDDEDEDEDEENDAEYAATYATAITFSGFWSEGRWEVRFSRRMRWFNCYCLLFGGVWVSVTGWFL